MKWKITEVDDQIRLFPSIGEVRITLLDQKGHRREVQFPLTKADKFAQLLTRIADTGRDMSKEQGFVWVLKDEDIGDMPMAKDFRLMPFRETGDLGIQFRVEDRGIAGVKLPEHLARRLSEKVPDNLTDFRIKRDGDQVSVDVAAITSLDKSRVKSPSAPLAIPDRFCAPIGRIIATWGQFEVQFSSFLKGMMAANGTESKQIQYNFKKRVARFREELVVAFPAQPGLRAYLSKLLTDASGLQWQRNLVAHGMYTSRVHVKKAENSPAVFVDVKMEATGNKYGKSTTLTFNKEKLESLYYDIAHLSGRMNAVSRVDLAENFGSPDERPELLTFLRNHHPGFPALTESSTATVRTQP